MLSLGFLKGSIFGFLITIFVNKLCINKNQKKDLDDGIIKKKKKE